MINARFVLFGTNSASVGRSCGASGISAYSLKVRLLVASNAAALFPSPRVPSLGKRGEGYKAAALEARLLVDSSITDGSALVLHPSLQGMPSSNVPAPFGSQSLFLLVSLCEVVNSSFALRASAVEPAFFTSLDKLSHNGLFLPDEDGCSCTFLSAQSCNSNFVS